MRWCPSARNAPGAELIGVFADGDARVRWLDGPLPVDDAGREWLAADGGETRFRFAAPCVTTRCARWAGHCTVGALLADGADGSSAVLPSCGLRSRCRWWAEQGAQACRRCPLVRTDRPPGP